MMIDIYMAISNSTVERNFSENILKSNKIYGIYFLQIVKKIAKRKSAKTPRHRVFVATFVANTVERFSQLLLQGRTMTISQVLLFNIFRATCLARIRQNYEANRMKLSVKNTSTEAKFILIFYLQIDLKDIAR